MLRALVVDDEWYNLEEISDLVEKTSLLYVVGKYQNPLKALEEATRINPQVAFIDIELPEMDGITLAEKLLEINPAIIIVFITSFNQYAVQAFDLNAIDYILKPIKIERFNCMIERIKNEAGNRAQNRPETLQIKCFGQFTVTVGNIPVKWKRAKAEELFAYLLMYHGTYVHKEKIIEELWSGYEPEKARQILQTSVCKIRGLFAQIKNMVRLDYSGNKYCLQIACEECDYFQVEQAIAQYRAEAPLTYTAVEKACVLYGSGFLADGGYLWSIEKDKKLQEDILKAMNEIVDSYRVQGKKDKIVTALKQIAKLIPFDEKVNLMIMKTYHDTGDSKAVFEHYQWLERILKTEYDTVPSENIRAMLECS